MVAPMQSAVAELIDGVINAFGPFVIPVALFALGAVGYLFLVSVGRAGVDDDAPANDARRSSDRRGSSPPDPTTDDTGTDESDRSEDV